MASASTSTAWSVVTSTGSSTASTVSSLSELDVDIKEFLVALLADNDDFVFLLFDDVLLQGNKLSEVLLSSFSGLTGLESWSGTLQDRT